MTDLPAPPHRARRAALLAAFFGVAYLAVYAAIVIHQHAAVGWGYVGLLVIACVLCGVTYSTDRPGPALAAAVIFGLCLLWGLFAVIGILALPATALSVQAFVLARRDRAVHPDRPTS